MAPLADSAPAPAGSGLLKGGLLLAGLLAAGLAARQASAHLLIHPRHGLAGAVELVLTGAALSAVGVPRQAVAFAGGYTFGASEGSALALLAQMLGCVADFAFARFAGRAWAMRRLATARSGRLARLDHFLAARPFAASLALRLLPVGNNLALNLLAGVSALPAWPFLAATLIGYVPQTLVFALAGSGVQVDRSYQIVLAVALFVASAGLGLALSRTALLRRRGD